MYHQLEEAERQHGTDDVVARECTARHLSHTRHKRHKGADEGHEAGDDDGDAAMALVERVRGVESLLVEEAALLPLEHLGPEIAPDRVIALVAQDGRHQQHGNRQRQVHRPHAAQRAHHEEQ